MLINLPYVLYRGEREKKKEKKKKKERKGEKTERKDLPAEGVMVFIFFGMIYEFAFKQRNKTTIMDDQHHQHSSSNTTPSVLSNAFPATQEYRFIRAEGELGRLKKELAR